MARRQSPMKTKVFMANVREWKKANKLEPTPPKKPREFHLTRSEKIRLELSKRSFMTPEQRATRALFVGSVRQACL